MQELPFWQQLTHISVDTTNDSRKKRNKELRRGEDGCNDDLSRPEQNINLPTALLSRFDITFILLDKPDVSGRVLKRNRLELIVGVCRRIKI